MYFPVVKKKTGKDCVAAALKSCGSVCVCLPRVPQMMMTLTLQPLPWKGLQPWAGVCVCSYNSHGTTIEHSSHWTLSAFSSAVDPTGWKLFDSCVELLKSRIASNDLDKDVCDKLAQSDNLLMAFKQVLELFCWLPLVIPPHTLLYNWGTKPAQVNTFYTFVYNSRLDICIFSFN